MGQTVCIKCGEQITRYNTSNRHRQRKGGEQCGDCYLKMKREERKANGLS